MNKRIRKKKAKQQLIRAISGLVEAAEEMQREQERRTRQAGISYIKYIEVVRERQYGIKPVCTPLFEKEGAYSKINKHGLHGTRPYSLRVSRQEAAPLQLNTAAPQQQTQRGDL